MISMKWSSARLAGAAALVGALCAVSTTAFAQLTAEKFTNANSLGDLLFDRSDDWKEKPISSLPPLPSDKDLLPFDVSTASRLNYQIDSKSISVGSDGVIRYTVVISSPSGARNIRYEGIHCSDYRWRLYSGANSDGTSWDNASTDWARIGGSDLNGYHAALFNDYFCDNKIPVARANNIVQSIRYHRSLREKDYRD